MPFEQLKFSPIYATVDNEGDEAVAKIKERTVSLQDPQARGWGRHSVSEPAELDGSARQELQLQRQPVWVCVSRVCQ